MMNHKEITCGLDSSGSEHVQWLAVVNRPTVKILVI